MNDHRTMLAGARVLVTGAGGLGCAALYCLAAAGVGHISVVDGDRVEESNLNRQLLYGYEDIGKYKAELAAERLMRQFPKLCCRPETVYADETNCAALLGGQDIVLTCLDSAAARLVVNAAALDAKTPMVDAGVSGGFMRLMCVIPGVTPCLKCVTDGTDAAGEPVFGPVAVAAGAMQAGAALNLLTGRDEPTAHGMLVMSFSDYSSELLPVKRRAGCACAGISGR